MKQNIFIIAGEPSGDIRAAELLRELKKITGGLSFWGVGGDKMRAEGVELIGHIKDFSIIGVWEAIVKLPRLLDQYRIVTRNIASRNPGLAILVDYPGFNLKIASYLHARGIPTVYYIIPQVWAWGAWRVKALKKYIDKALVLFKFEKIFLSGYGITSEFVGHPLADSLVPEREEHSGFNIALLPGSRDTEVRNMFPVMLDTAKELIKTRGDIKFIVARNSGVDKSLYDIDKDYSDILKISSITDDTMKTLSMSDFALVVSGTATLETAIAEKPMLVTYKAAPFTALMFYLFVRLPYISLVNIIAGKGIVPEVKQDDARPEVLSKAILEIINDDSQMRKMSEELRKVKAELGEKGAAKRAAEAIGNFIKERVFIEKVW